MFNDIVYNIIELLFVLDTCVLVSAIRSSSGASARLLDRALRGELGIVCSVALCLEYEDVLKRPENRVAEWSDADLEQLIEGVIGVAEIPPLDFRHRPVLADPGDELVLEAAINGKAEIVTFNVRDFAPAMRFGVRVFRPGDLYLEILKGDLAYGEE